MKEGINPEVACPRFPCQGDKSFCDHFYTGSRIQTFFLPLTRISTPKTGGEAKSPPWLLYARSGGWEPMERCRSLGHLETTKPATNSRAVPQSAALREAERGFGPSHPEQRLPPGALPAPPNAEEPGLQSGRGSSSLPGDRARENRGKTTSPASLLRASCHLSE